MSYESLISTCPSLTLNNIRGLFSIMHNGALSQNTFLNALPGEIKSTFFYNNRQENSESDGQKPCGSAVSALYNHNSRKKIVSQRYYTFKSLVIDENHNTLDYKFFDKLKKVCRDYADIYLWTKVSVDPEFVKQTMPSLNTEAKSISPLELLYYWFEIPDQDDLDEISFKNIFRQSYERYKMNPIKGNLTTLISYALLCSIFPRPDILDGYRIPSAISSPIDDIIQNVKYDIFKDHPAINKISEILEKNKLCIISGTHGCGKKSIVNVFEYNDSFRNFSAFYYCSLTDIKAPACSQETTPLNLPETLEAIERSIQNNSLPAVIIFSDWNGYDDTKFRKVLNIKNCKFIFLTANAVSKGIIFPDCWIDLNSEYQEAKKLCSQNVFKNIYGTPHTSIEEYSKLDFLLKSIDYHFFTTIILARSLCKHQKTISEKKEQLAKSQKLFDESDVLPYTGNLGLDYISNSMSDYLRLLCLMPSTGITFDFFSLLVDNKETGKIDYNKCLECSFIQEGSGITYFYLRPHIKQVLMGYSNFSLENELIFQLFIRIANIVETYSENLQDNNYLKYSRELLSLVEFILKVFPYKPAQFTSTYMSLIRFLWISDKPKTALSFLTQMEKSISKPIYRYLSADLAQIQLTMGYVYNSLSDYEKAVSYLKSASETFAQQYTSSHSLQVSAEAVNSPFRTQDIQALSADADMRKKMFGETSDEFYTTKLQLARYLVNKLPILPEQDKEQAFHDTNLLLDECLQYFSIHNKSAAFATSLYLKARLFRKCGNKDYTSIIDYLTKAEQLRASIRGKYHSWMISIYLEEAEVYLETADREKSSEYLEKLNKIIKSNHEIVFTELQKERIERIRWGRGAEEN